MPPRRPSSSSPTRWQSRKYRARDYGTGILNMQITNLSNSIDMAGE
jgi:hypothetical protein